MHAVSDGRWRRLGLTRALEELYPDFEETVGAGGRLSDRVVFDTSDVAYTLLVVRLASDETRNVLLWSRDGCATWDGAELPEGLVVCEQPVGHNVIAGPPFLLIQRPAAFLAGSPARCYRLLVTQPRLVGDHLVVPAPVEVSDRALRLSTASGCSSPAVTVDGRTHITWAEATTADQPGTPTFAATFDPFTTTVTPKALLAWALPRNDGHCIPGITADSHGVLHVVTGAHARSFKYVRSLAPGTFNLGWTLAANVLWSGFVTPATDADGDGRQTYPSLVCGPDDTLHLVSRQYRFGVDDYHRSRFHSALVHQSCRPGGMWSLPRLLVVAPAPGYGIFNQRLTVDRRGGLWVSCSYNGGAERDFWQEQVREWEMAGSVGPRPGPFRRRMVLFSGDAGRSWRLATTADFLAGIATAPSPQPVVPLPSEAASPSVAEPAPTGPAEPTPTGSPVLAAPATGEPPAGGEPLIAPTPTPFPLPSPTPAQPLAWRWQNPLPQGNYLTAVDVASASTAWAVGGAGTILRSSDGGFTWEAIGAQTRQPLYDVDFVDERRGWIVGACGTILSTTDGGATWTRRRWDTDEPLCGVAFGNVRRGWAVGGAGLVLRTVNGGRTWTKRRVPTTLSFNGVAAAGAAKAWIAGNGGRVLTTTDGGASWAKHVDVASNHLRRVRLTGGSVWAVGESGALLRSTDGGANWSRLDRPSEETLADIAFADGLLGWIVGSGGVTLQTTDGGLTWAQADTGVSHRLNGVAWLPGGAPVAVGARGAVWGGRPGVAAATADVGWSRLTAGPEAHLRNVAALSATTAVAVGDGGMLLATRDGGDHWQVRDSGVPVALDAVTLRPDGTGLAAGARETILRTTDSGDTWAVVSAAGPGGPGGAPSPTPHLRALAWAGDVAAWAAGDAGAALVSTDSGLTWEARGLPTTSDLNDVWFSDALNGWLVGGDPDWNDRAVVLRTTDGGLHWTAAPTTIRGGLTGVRFSDALKGWATAVDWGADMDAPRGVILRTVDGGASWRVAHRIAGRRLLGLDLVSASEIWACGDAGLTLRSTDRGRTWVRITSRVARPLRSIDFAARNAGWAVGEGGAVVAWRPAP